LVRAHNLGMLMRN